jgi:hypothetical protein
MGDLDRRGERGPDPLRVIRQVYRQHMQRPSIDARFIADQAIQMVGFGADRQGYVEEHERYRAAAAEWLRLKFGRGRMVRRRAG